MELTHIRTENGHATLITTRAALDEINAGMLDKAVKRTIRQMSAARSSANIEYRDGRKVDIRPATPEEIAEHTAQATSEKTPPSRVPAFTIADKTGVTTDDVINAAIELAAEWGNGAVWRSVVTSDADLSPEAAEELAKRLAPVAPERTADGRRIVTVKGKRYIVDNHVSQDRTVVHGGVERTWPGGVYYWNERNGETFGATRTAFSDSKPGTVGAAIWAAASAGRRESA